MSTMDENVVLSLKNVGLSYRRRAGFLKRKDFWALKDVTLDLRKGETLGVLGRNGVGKSSLLRIMAGIVDPSCGEVRSAGLKSTMLSLQVGFVGHLNGKENAVISGMLLGMSKKDVVQRLSDIVAFADIGDSINQPVETYSSGMRARLGFSVAIHVAPDIVLLDEVLGVGDADFKKKSQLALESIVQSQKTAVIVSHNFETISRLCTRAVFMDKGRTLEIGDVDYIIDCYQKHKS